MMSNFEHFAMNAPEIKFKNGVFSFEKSIYADVVDMADEAIVAACIRAAKEAGLTDLYLLDKEFVLGALKRALSGGEWIIDDDCGGIVLSCSMCNEHYWTEEDTFPKFCPNCGARNEVQNERV